MEFDKVIGGGRGFRMAFAVGQNGLSGPNALLIRKSLVRAQPGEPLLDAVLPSSSAAPRGVCHRMPGYGECDKTHDKSGGVAELLLHEGRQARALGVAGHRVEERGQVRVNDAVEHAAFRIPRLIGHAGRSARRTRSKLSASTSWACASTSCDLRTCSAPARILWHLAWIHSPWSKTAWSPSRNSALQRKHLG